MRLDDKKFNQHQAYHLLKEQPQHKYRHVVELIFNHPDLSVEDIARSARVPVDYVFAVHGALVWYCQ